MRPVLLVGACMVVLLAPGAGFSDPYEEVAEFEIVDGGLGPPLYDNRSPVIVELSEDRLLVVWMYRLFGYSRCNDGLKGVLLDRSGEVVDVVPLDDCVPLRCMEMSPDAAAAGDGSAVVLWSTGYSLSGAYISSTGDVECVDLSSLVSPGAEIAHPRIAPADDGYRIAWIEIPILMNENLMTAVLDPSGLSVPGTTESIAAVNAVRSGWAEEPLDICRYGDGHVVACDNDSTLEIWSVASDGHVSPPASFIGASYGMSGVSVEAKGDVVGVAAAGFRRDRPSMIVDADIYTVTFNVDFESAPAIIGTTLLNGNDQEAVAKPFFAGFMGEDLVVLWNTGWKYENLLRVTPVLDDGTVGSSESIAMNAECTESTFPSVASNSSGSVIVWAGTCGFYNTGDLFDFPLYYFNDSTSINVETFDSSGRIAIGRRHLSREPLPIFNPRGAYIPEAGKYVVTLEGYDERLVPGRGVYDIRDRLLTVDTGGTLSGELLPAPPCSDWDESHYGPQPIHLEGATLMISNPRLVAFEGVDPRSAVVARRIDPFDPLSIVGCMAPYFPADEEDEYVGFAATPAQDGGLVILGSAERSYYPYATLAVTSLDAAPLSGEGVLATPGTRFAVESEGVVDVAVAPSLDGTRYLVAWGTVMDEDMDTRCYLKGALMDAQGRIVRDAFPIYDQSVEYEASEILPVAQGEALACAPLGGGGFLVVASLPVITEEYGYLFLEKQQIVSFRLSAEGEVLSGGPATVRSEATYQYEPRLIHDGRNTVMAWLKYELVHDPEDDSIIGERSDVMLDALDGDGAPSWETSVMVSGEDEKALGIDLAKGPGQVMVLYDFTDSTQTRRSAYIRGKIFEVQDQAPQIDAGGPYWARAEDTSVTLAATASDPDGDPLTVGWDFDGDGYFDDADGLDAPFPVSPSMAGMTIEVSAIAVDPCSKSAVDTAVIHVEEMVAEENVEELAGPDESGEDTFLEEEAQEGAEGCACAVPR